MCVTLVIYQETCLILLRPTLSFFGTCDVTNAVCHFCCLPDSFVTLVVAAVLVSRGKYV